VIFSVEFMDIRGREREEDAEYRIKIRFMAFIPRQVLIG